MEHKVVGRIVAERVAIDAAIMILAVRHNRLFFKGGQVALVDSHPVPQFVARFYQAVGDPGVYAARRNMHRKGLITDASGMSVGPDGDRHIEGFPGITAKPFFPVFFRKLHARSALQPCQLVSVCFDDRLYFPGFGYTEIQGCDVTRDCHTGIIGENGRIVLTLRFRLLIVRSASCQ